MRKFKFCLTLLLLCMFSAVFAQEYGMEYNNEGRNPNTLRPIHESDIMFRKRLTYRLDLRQKQNKPLFANNQEITKLIIEAAKLGVIRPFEDETLATRMDHQTFQDNLKMDMGEPLEGVEWGFTDPAIWEDGEDGDGAEIVADEYFPSQLYILEFTEDLIFDRKRSRLIHDIQAVTIKIPAAYNPAGYEENLATFSYKELVNNLFRDNPDAIWYNTQNSDAHMNLEDAFDLRLFAARIIKYDNPNDQMILDIAGEGRTGALAELGYQHKLTAYENNLWEN